MMVSSHVVSHLLLEDSPRDIALVDIFVRDLTTISCSFFLSTFYCALVSVEAVKVDELLFDEVALTLVVTVGAS